ncbi:hypothetical protein NFI96_001475 [Prochilodus magdalenae]|nr:hypothetical protein NFI96_001475 [Prochilodus magdalenae]
MTILRDDLMLEDEGGCSPYLYLHPYASRKFECGVCEVSGGDTYRKCIKHSDCDYATLKQMFPQVASFSFRCCSTDLCNGAPQTTAISSVLGLLASMAVLLWPHHSTRVTAQPPHFTTTLHRGYCPTPALHHHTSPGLLPNPRTSPPHFTGVTAQPPHFTTTLHQGYCPTTTLHQGYCPNTALHQCYCPTTTLHQAYCPATTLHQGYCPNTALHQCYCPTTTLHQAYCPTTTLYQGYCPNTALHQGYWPNTALHQGYCPNTALHQGYCPNTALHQAYCQTAQPPHFTRLTAKLPNPRTSPGLLVCVHCKHWDLGRHSYLAAPPCRWTVRDDSSSAAAQCSVGHPLVPHQWTQDVAHRTLPSGHCHTGRCPQDAALRTLPHRTLPTGRCPQDPATQDAALRTLPHRTLPTGRCPQDAAHRTMPSGHCPTGRCPQDAAHRTLLAE